MKSIRLSIAAGATPRSKAWRCLFLRIVAAVVVSTPAADAHGQAMDGSGPAASRIEQHMRVLAHERMRGRLTGTEEYARAAQYVADILQQHGARPLSGGDLRMRFDATRTTADDIALELLTGDERATRIPTEQLCVLPGTGGPLQPTLLPLRKLSHGSGDVARHIAWSESGPLPGTTGVAGELSARYTEKRRLAAAAGADALLILLPDAQDSEEWRGRRRWCSQGELVPAARDPQLPVVFVSREAAALVRDASTSETAKAQVRLTRTRRPHVGINVVSRFGPPSSEVVVVTAHLDHIGIVSDDAGRQHVAPGAVDNASGVAALLELAGRLGSSPPASRTVVLAATDAEEAGLVGSMVLVDQLARSGLKAVATVNIDGATLMQHPLVDLVALGGKDSSLGEVAVSAGKDAGVEVNLEHTPIAGSDHFPFAQAGIPAVWLVAGTKTNLDDVDGAALQERWMREVYHSPRDDLSQPLTFTAAARLVDVLESLVRRLGGSQPAPAWNRGALWAKPRH